jgi:hypothetical protein
MKLKHVALYSKHHYERSGDVWEDIKKCLIADDYTPYSKTDVLNIIIRNVTPLFHHNTPDFATILIDGISPHNCWKYGFYHKGCAWVKDCKEFPEYDYETATLYFFLSTLMGSTIMELGGLPDADKKVLPFSKDLKRELRSKKTKK